MSMRAHPSSGSAAIVGQGWPQRAAIVCQIMFERFGWLTERGNCPQILILYLNIYTSSAIRCAKATEKRRRVWM